LLCLSIALACGLALFAPYKLVMAVTKSLVLVAATVLLIAALLRLEK
jgi:hypothetical protein